MSAEGLSINNPRPSTYTSAGSEIVERDPLIERVVRELNMLGRVATLDFTISVGALIISQIYSGDLRAWRNRGPKCSSFRRLATHPDLPMSACSLYRCVAIYELCERLGVRSWKHVSTTHLRLVLPLRPEQQEHLLKAAETGRWPVRQLRDEIAANVHLVQRLEASRGGRKRRSPVRRTVDAINQCIGACDHLLTASAEASPETWRMVLSAVERMHDVCERLEHRFKPYVTDSMAAGDEPHSFSAAS